jgi:polyphosphate kinase
VAPHASEEPGGPRLINRELSRLDFISRVLALAEDQDLAVLERAKFLAITSQSIDEFFQVRVAALKEQADAAVQVTSPEGMSPREQLTAIRARAEDLLERQTTAFAKQVVPDLDAAGIRFSSWNDLDDDDRSYLDEVFEQKIFPVLTPLAVDPAHPFPYVSNLSLNLALVLRHRKDTAHRVARVKVPPILPRFVVMPDGERFVPLEQVIGAHLGSLFPGMEIVAQYTFRVTRDALYETDDEAADLLEAVEAAIRLRKRSRLTVRLEVERGTSDEVFDLLVRELELEPSDVYRVEAPLDLTGLWTLYELDRPDLKDDPWIATTQPRLAPRGADLPDLFDVLCQGDVLVHHPYDSFRTSVEAFLQQAARDPSVLAIKQTLYRTSTTESPTVRALIRAAGAGKQVVVLVELQARFDEEANIAWARVLEEAGVHVVYGVVGLKTHAKICLVVRQEASGIRRYVHIGTGNYNPDTARVYEDLGLLSTDPDLGADLSQLFNFLTGYSERSRYAKLLVAPTTLRNELIRLIQEEAARPEGRIVMKINNLSDVKIIEALYGASAAGCEIDLVVRSVCCLRPGVPGLSENIRVRSIVGRYLEHSRIFRFGRSKARWYLGSADMMTRNLDDRVEAVTPVAGSELTKRLAEIIEVNLADDMLAWELMPDGSWRKVSGGAGIDAQRRLKELAEKRSELRVRLKEARP